MTRPARLLPLALVALVAAAGSASAFTATNRYVVRDIGGGRFEVQPRGGLSDANAWCAAGDYAGRVLGMNTGRIWRISPPPRRSGDGITFSTSPQGAASSTGMATLGGQGGSKSVSSAQAICNTLRPDSRRR